MFTYDLYTHEMEGSIPGHSSDGWSSYRDAIQQSGDAVVVVFPYKDADTFNFSSLTTKQIAFDPFSENTYASPVEERDTETRVYALDPLITSISVRQGKQSHQGVMQITALDPNGELLRKISPGDWIVCWMFDNSDSGKALRDKIKSQGFANLNGFDSGLKMVGKVFTIRKDVQVDEAGRKFQRVNLMATSFSELDSNVYFDPQLVTSWYKGAEFMLNLSSNLNRITPLPEDVSTLMATLLATFLGIQLGGQQGATSPNRPLIVPPVISQILGIQAKNYIDILKTYVGIQEYSTSYVPQPLGVTSQLTLAKNQTTQPSPHPNIRYTRVGLLGFNNPMIQPYVNVPIWGILSQYLNPVINEMYTTLRLDEAGKIMPSLMIRQIPFNTDAFASGYPDVPATTFRSLPRWRVQDPVITNYSVGKSEAMRVNFVMVQSVTGITPKQFAAYQRASFDPFKDSVDIERNGLRAYIQAVNANFGDDITASTAKQFTALVTDRMVGGHLKLSGQMGLAGVQEPIAVGDNLEYNGLLFHIESVIHTLTVHPTAGLKRFSTQLEISNGVPASGPVLPEIDIRETEEWYDPMEGKVVQTAFTGNTQRVGLPMPVSTNYEKD